MELKINDGNHAKFSDLFKRRNIPCIVKVKHKGLEIAFPEALNIGECSGSIVSYDSVLMKERLFFSAGGTYLIYEPALVTLKKIEENLFSVIDFSIFYSFLGRINIIKNGEYSELHHYVKAISCRENEEDMSMIVGSASDTELKKRLFAELEKLDFELLSNVGVEHIRDLYQYDFGILNFNYYQFPMFVKQVDSNLILEGPKGVVREITEKINKKM